MKRIVLAASAALLLAAPGLSLAQDDHHHEGGGHPSSGGGAAPQYHPQSAPQPRAATPTQPAPQFHTAPQFHNAPQAGQGFSRGGYPYQSGQPTYHPPATGGQGGYRPSGQNPTYYSGGQGGYRPQTGQQGVQGGYHGGQVQGYNPGYRGGQGQRAGGQAFGYGGRQYFRYRAAPYRFPGGYYGWQNHSWRLGEWLPPVFIAQDYYINDWYDFGLWQPDYGYEWIRVGYDAVLVNLADGQVVDVVPGVYYY